MGCDYCGDERRRPRTGSLYFPRFAGVGANDFCFPGYSSHGYRYLLGFLTHLSLCCLRISLCSHAVAFLFLANPPPQNTPTDQSPCHVQQQTVAILFLPSLHSGEAFSSPIEAVAASRTRHQYRLKRLFGFEFCPKRIAGIADRWRN
jgi:hypothetical protein